MSQSECELDESNAAVVESAESQNAQNLSDDDTDVDSIPETSTQQTNASVDRIDDNASKWIVVLL